MHQLLSATVGEFELHDACDQQQAPMQPACCSLLPKPILAGVAVCAPLVVRGNHRTLLCWDMPRHQARFHNAMATYSDLALFTIVGWRVVHKLRSMRPWFTICWNLSKDAALGQENVKNRGVVSVASHTAAFGHLLHCIFVGIGYGNKRSHSRSHRTITASSLPRGR